MTARRAHIHVSGRVQGVFFRANTRDVARHLGLTGWVKNCPDGRVEIIAEGDQTGLKKLIAWCHKGPPLAHVTKVDVDWGAATGEYSNFDLRF